MDSTLPLLIGASGAAYLLLRKKKSLPGANVVITATKPSGYQTPPSANPADLAIPKSEVVDIQGFGAAYAPATPKLIALSAEVLQRQALAASKCPKLTESYKDLATDVAYQLTLPGDPGYVDTLAGQLKTLNATCNQGVAAVPPSSAGSMLPLFAIAGIAAYLMFS